MLSKDSDDKRLMYSKNVFCNEISLMLDEKWILLLDEIKKSHLKPPKMVMISVFIDSSHNKL